MAPPNVEIAEYTISLPRCDRGLGKIIQSPNSPDLIDGVRIQAGVFYPDDRGYFLEVARSRQGLIADHDPETTQVSASLSYPGAIKAFHFHRRQTDYWCPVMGMLQVALVDLTRSFAEVLAPQHALRRHQLRLGDPA